MQRVWSTYLPQSSDGYGGNMDSTGGRIEPLEKMLNGTLHPATSLTSMASSQHHLLDGHDAPLEPPLAPFAGRAPQYSPGGSPRSSTRPLSGADISTVKSLSLNYLPSKFSNPLSAGSIYKRKVKGSKSTNGFAKQGGGREAFKKGEARMPEDKDEDYDGVDIKRGSWKTTTPLRWNRFKWILFCTNLLVSVYSFVALIFCLLTWFNIWTHADVIRVGNRTLLILSTVASLFGILSSLLGWAGILLNNRGYLATYTFTLWVTFAFICAPGYVAYKTHTFNLEGKVNHQWSRSLGQTGRLRIQNQLGCCGYYSPFVEATVSQMCYARSVLPGCKNEYIKFERMTLSRWYAVAFGLIPFHLFAILAALLCSNHVTYRFGKGMMPKAYRLNMNSMAVIVDNYATQLAEQYGVDVASDLNSRSRSNLQLDCVPSLSYVAGPRNFGSRGPSGLDASFEGGRSGP